MEARSLSAPSVEWATDGLSTQVEDRPWYDRFLRFVAIKNGGPDSPESELAAIMVAKILAADADTGDHDDNDGKGGTAGN